eukprot:TRINITY_DN372_c3_g2_i1.p1 TRINITY_DN372_c3_g2~~TRINITY_DN372_c3_g2_i1.p1  ORF type:complete len:180 (+),score=58.01 TRINITY_DN372_c3_g2_i1:176-715(+)
MGKGNNKKKKKNNNNNNNNNKNKKKSGSLLVLCGIPGSGKSTLGRELERLGWVWINQDEVGNSKECMKLMKKHLQKGSRVVLDRCNPNAKERKMWIREAQNLNITDIQIAFLNTPYEECLERVAQRQNHQNLQGDDEETVSVIETFRNIMQPPTEYERVTVHDCCFESISDLKQFAKTL